MSLAALTLVKAVPHEMTQTGGPHLVKHLGGGQVKRVEWGSPATAEGISVY